MSKYFLHLYSSFLSPSIHPVLLPLRFFVFPVFPHSIIPLFDYSRFLFQYPNIPSVPPSPCPRFSVSPFLLFPLLSAYPCPSFPHPPLSSSPYLIFCRVPVFLFPPSRLFLFLPIPFYVFSPSPHLPISPSPYLPISESPISPSCGSPCPRVSASRLLRGV
jgi:hypothetical protein